MNILLAIETSTHICSVALWQDGKLLALKESDEKNVHSRLLSSMIIQLLDENKVSKDDIVAIAVSMGPGSYTGLRIGVSIAKGLCYGWSKPLIAVDTIKAQAAQYILTVNHHKTGSENILLCPMFDARRMEVYTALYDIALNEISPPEAMVVDSTSFNEFLIHKEVFFFGNGAAKCKELITSSNAVFVENVNPSSLGVAYLAEKLFQENKFVDVAYFEPFYMKEFIAGKPSKKIF